jgi:excisionase family DNA binding protein
VPQHHRIVNGIHERAECRRETVSEVEVLAVNVREAARRLGVSPRTIATLIARGELASRKIGRRRVIPVEALEKFLRRDHLTQRDCQKAAAE